MFIAKYPNTKVITIDMIQYLLKQKV